MQIPNAKHARGDILLCAVTVLKRLRPGTQLIKISIEPAVAVALAYRHPLRINI